MENQSRAEQENVSKDVQDKNHNQENAKPICCEGNDSEQLDISFNTTMVSQDSPTRSESPSIINHSPTHQPTGSSCRSPKSDIESKPDENAKTETDDGSSSDTAGSPSRDSPPSVTPVSPPTSNRERCWYGAQCYRRNPQHKTEYSHPTDPDWGSAVRVSCRFGHDCQKTDPRHLRDYDHPPKPAKTAKKRQQRKQSNNSSDSDREMSPLPDSHLPAKRKRKTTQIQSIDESGSEEDPYMTDGSDEWQPPSAL